MRVLVLLSILLLATAGCSGTDDEPSQGLPEAQPQQMAIRGVVVDNAITPLLNVTIDVLGTNFTLTTAADGEFFIPVAAAGSFELAINKADFIAVRQVVTVAQDEVVDLQIILEAIPYLEPTSEAKKWDGFIQCSLRTPQNAYFLCAAADELGDDATERYEEIDTPPTFVQSELVWTSQQPLADNLRLMYTDDYREGTDNYRAAQGESPVMVNADNKTLQFKHLDSQGLYLRVITGDYQATGASLTLQQGFTVITSVYHNYTPPEGWMYVDADALHPAPRDP